MTIHDPTRRAAIRAAVDELLARDRHAIYAAKLTAADRAQVKIEARELYEKHRDKRLGKNLLTKFADGSEP